MTMFATAIIDTYFLHLDHNGVDDLVFELAADEMFYALRRPRTVAWRRAGCGRAWHIVEHARAKRSTRRKLQLALSIDFSKTESV